MSQALPLRRLRRLDLAAPTQQGRRPHLAAASGIVRVGGTLLVIADDESCLGVFGAVGDQPGTTVALGAALGPGTLPLAAAARKAAKLDFEALAHVPGVMTGSPGGAALALGSGSTPGRRRAAWVPLGGDGAPGGAPTLADLSPLYEALLATLPELNIEGAAIVGEALWLAHRGNGAGGDALIELDAAAVTRAAAAAAPIGAGTLRRIVAVELGTLDDVELTLTDLSPLADGRLAFAAAAEASGGTYDDGPVTGSAVGVLDTDGRVQAMRRVAGRDKLEGIHATAARGGLDLLLVTDADDPEQPASLFAAHLPLP